MLKVFNSLAEVDIAGKEHDNLPLGPEGVLHGVLSNGLTCVMADGCWMGEGGAWAGFSQCACKPAAFALFCSCYMHKRAFCTACSASALRSPPPLPTPALGLTNHAPTPHPHTTQHQLTNSAHTRAHALMHAHRHAQLHTSAPLQILRQAHNHPALSTSTIPSARTHTCIPHTPPPSADTTSATA